ncbi:MAG: ankyrin repeat domain-containing protein, partial [Candidatus Aminicenantes bacterium]|nr:ankyrin repeat domain-containing protein [Candidatus Aminicenantes bacterium]
MLALRIGSIKIVNQHLQQRKEFLFVSDGDKNNALHFAVQSNSRELVIQLLNLGVPIPDKTIYDW